MNPISHSVEILTWFLFKRNLKEKKPKSWFKILRLVYVSDYQKWGERLVYFSLRKKRIFNPRATISSIRVFNTTGLDSWFRWMTRCLVRNQSQLVRVSPSSCIFFDSLCIVFPLIRNSYLLYLLIRDGIYPGEMNNPSAWDVRRERERGGQGLKRCLTPRDSPWERFFPLLLVLLLILLILILSRSIFIFPTIYSLLTTLFISALAYTLIFLRIRGPDPHFRASRVTREQQECLLQRSRRPESRFTTMLNLEPLF